MKAEKIITATIPVEMEITDVLTLSIEEYEAAKHYIPAVNRWWWLRSPGYGSYDAAGVLPDGGVYDHGLNVGDSGVSVRPALKLTLKTGNLQIGERIKIAGLIWTAIPGDMALCDECVGKTAFREDWGADNANRYDCSDLKAWIKQWAEERGIL